LEQDDDAETDHLYCCGAASEVRNIMEDEAANVSQESDKYWVLAAALKRYVDQEGKGQLPIEVQ